MTDEQDHEEERRHREAVTRDRVVARRIDEEEIRERSIAAFDRFVKMGFTAHLIAVNVRGAVEYRIALYPDGTRTLAADTLADVAREFNFDYQMEQDPALDGWLILMYPLT